MISNEVMRNNGDKPFAIVLEDNLDLLEVYTALLADNYVVEAFPSLSDFQARLGAVPDPDLFLADIDLGDGKLTSLLGDEKIGARIRRWPTLIVTVDDDLETMRGLSAWATDYLTKPFNNNELVFRCAKIRDFNDLSLGSSDFIVRSRGLVTEPLTAIEAKVFSFLKDQPGRRATRMALLAQVWGGRRDTGKLDTTLTRLRKKLEAVRFSVKSVGPGQLALIAEP